MTDNRPSVKLRPLTYSVTVQADEAVSIDQVEAMIRAGVTEAGGPGCVAEIHLGAAPAGVTEHGILMSGGGFQVRNAAPEIEEIFPLAQWIPGNRRHGGHVYRRRIVVLEDWHEVDDQGDPL